MHIPPDLRSHLAKAERAALGEKLIELPPLLDGTAASLAVAGHVDAALELWRLLRAPRLPVVPLTAFGDGSLTSVCLLTGQPDLGRGEPRPSWLRDRTEVPDLAARAELHQQWIHARLTLTHQGAEQLAPRPGAPGEEFRRDTRRLHDALSTLRTDEVAAFAQLRALSEESRLPERRRLELRLLTCDHDARHGRVEQADRGLLDWYERARRAGGDAHTPLGLLAVARRLLAGVLGEASGVDRAHATRSAGAIAARVRGRLDAAEDPNPPRPSYRVAPSFGSIYLEPRNGSSEHHYFAEERDSERGYSLFDDHVGLAVPDIAEVDVEVTVVDALPADADLSFALRVSDDIYLRTVDEGGDARRFAVPSGAWRAAVSVREVDEDLCEVRVALARAGDE